MRPRRAKREAPARARRICSYEQPSISGAARGDTATARARAPTPRAPRDSAPAPSPAQGRADLGEVIQVVLGPVLEHLPHADAAVLGMAPGGGALGGRQPADLLEVRRAQRRVRDEQDRKSTRLNSSH